MKIHFKYFEAVEHWAHPQPIVTVIHFYCTGWVGVADGYQSRNEINGRSWVEGENEWKVSCYVILICITIYVKHEVRGRDSMTRRDKIKMARQRRKKNVKCFFSARNELSEIIDRDDESSNISFFLLFLYYFFSALRGKAAKSESVPFFFRANI